MTKQSQIAREVTEIINGIDRSQNVTVVEYAVQNLFKHQSPKKAAENTAKRLGGSPNMLLGVHPPSVVYIDQEQLEEALWDRLVDTVIKGIPKFKPDKANWSLNGTLLHFHQRPALRAELKRRVIARLGGDPFEGLE
jgi:hypothetical protein